MNKQFVAKNFSLQKFQILALLVFISFVAFVAILIYKRGLFEYIGIDYRLWYSSGMIARFHGFASIYDPALQSMYQYPLYDQYHKITPMSMDFWPLPLPYLPIFIFPFLFFTLFSPISGFQIWSFINIIGTFLYIFSFLKRENLPITGKILYVFIALPFFLNIAFGQINLWLLICLGETALALKNGQDFKSGVWLGGLLLKPQLLILFIPGLLLTKRFKMLLGLFFSSVFVVITSYLLAGQTAVLGPFNVISGWPTVFLGDSGMNFLSLANNLSKIIPFEYSRLIMMFFSIIVFLATIWLWLPKNKPMQIDNLELLFMATFAATCAISPHSNVHMAIPLLPLGLAAYTKKQLPAELALGWILIPSTLFLLMSIESVGNAHAIGGMSVLGVNIAIVIWMIRKRIPRSNISLKTDLEDKTIL